MTYVEDTVVYTCKDERDGLRLLPANKNSNRQHETHPESPPKRFKARFGPSGIPVHTSPEVIFATRGMYHPLRLAMIEAAAWEEFEDVRLNRVDATEGNRKQGAAGSR